MRALKIPIALAALCCLNTHLSAQDKLPVKFGKVKAEDFDIKSVLIDSSTNAVVVADVGNSTFIANTSDLTFSLIYTRKKRIKIINKSGFDAATVIIPLSVYGAKTEKLEDLDAFTYNLEGGKVVGLKVDKGSVFTEQYNKNLQLKKFTFPALKEGSIIEYSYRVKSDFFFNLQSWTFQGDYPVLWSQYDAAIPEFYKYVILSQGYQPFFINKNEHSKTSFSFIEHVERQQTRNMAGVTSSINNFNIDGDVEYHSWVMKDVPALKEEAFTTTIRNSVAKIEFQLNQVVFPQSAPRNYMESWEKIADDLMNDAEFGLAINRPNNWLDKEVADASKNGKSPLEVAKNIFSYVRDNFTSNSANSIYITAGLKEVTKNKTGSVADINLLLIAMLKNQKIDARPVILSSRSHGFTHEFYPLMNRYNYVIAKVVIDNQEFYLDATNAHCAFGKLPVDVYNGQAREINNHMASPVYFVADSLRESDITSVFIANMDDGSVKGSFKHNLGFYQSLNLRNKLNKLSSDDYKKSIVSAYPEDIQVEHVIIDSLRLLGDPVAVKCDMTLKAFGTEDIVYFNPMVGAALKKNPFTAAQRFYPVEMPYTIDDMYVLSMAIPKGYKIDEMPKSARIKFNEEEGMFEYLLSSDAENIQMRCRLLLKKANYTNEDYASLRDFYAFIVKKEAEQIVFKKIK